MERQEVESVLISTVNSYLEKIGYNERVSIQTDLGNLKKQLDSLDTIALIMEIEDKFDISIPNDDITKIFQSKGDEYKMTNKVYTAKLSLISDYVHKKESENKLSISK